MPLGALIGAGASILGGVLQSKAASKQTALQKQFAKQGIRWKVEDAKAAGIHPLYALGTATTPYQPVQAGDMGIAAAGQDIGRAVDAGLTESERKTSPNRTLQALTIERAKIQNEILKADLAARHAVVNQAGRAPPKPVVNASTEEATRLNAKPTDTDWMLWGRKVPGMPGTSSAERIEETQGEIPSLAISAGHGGYGLGYYQLRDLYEKGYIAASLFKKLARTMKNPNSGKNRDRWNDERSAYLRRKYGYHGTVY